jgi:hypothetical protein
MKPSELFEALHALIAERVPLHIWGACGVGKSQIVANFTPCFSWLDERGIVPQTLVFLTDLSGAFPKEVPPHPVLWASTESRVAPFGQVIPMEAA